MWSETRFGKSRTNKIRICPGQSCPGIWHIWERKQLETVSIRRPMDSRLATRTSPRKPFLRCPRTLLSDPSACIHRVCPHIFGRRAKSRMGPVFASTCKAWVRWAVREESRVKISRATVDLHDLATVKEAEPAHRQAGICAKLFCRLCSAKPMISFFGPSVCLCQASSREMSITLVNVPGPTNWYQQTYGLPSLWNASCGRLTPPWPPNFEQESSFYEAPLLLQIPNGEPTSKGQTLEGNVR